MPQDGGNLHYDLGYQKLGVYKSGKLMHMSESRVILQVDLSPFLKIAARLHVVQW